MYYEWIQQHKRTIVICIAVFVVMMIGWGITTYVTRVGKVGVTIMAVPHDATVTINGQNVGSGTHWITPGTYSIAAAKDGFASRSKTVVATGKKSQNAVALSLTPTSDIAKQWAMAHENDYKKNEEYGAIEARANGDYFKQQNPVTNILPYTDPYYEIAYRQEGESVVITISTPSPRYRYLAVQKFRNLGFNPTQFKIEFSDFTNPLASRSSDD